jgi:hypothetical protein
MMRRNDKKAKAHASEFIACLHISKAGNPVRDVSAASKSEMQ